MSSRASGQLHPSPMIERVDRRIWPIVRSVVYIALGLAFLFRWGSAVRHVPSEWLTVGDLAGSTFPAAVALAHGHFGAIYRPGMGFLAFPGVLIVLAPLGALSNVFHGSAVVIGVNHHPIAHPLSFTFSSISNLRNLGPIYSQGREVVLHPQVVVALAVADLVLSSTALFACDALAERLHVARSRRAVLGVVEAIALWNVTVFGHPEDAVAVALSVYALIFAIEGRFKGAGWLFGAGLAFQPLVLLMLPVILVTAGWPRCVGVAVRSVVPAILWG